MKKTVITSTLLVLSSLLMLCNYLNAQVNLQDGLVAHYPFNGNANDEMSDNDGTVSGAQLTTDRFGNANSAYEFDGIDDYIDCGDEPEFQFSSDFSISVWIYFLGEPIYASIIAKRNFSSNFNQYYMGFIEDVYEGPDPADYPTFFVRRDDSDGVNNDGPIGASQYPLTEGWHHITVCNQLNGERFMYLNGELIGSANGPQGTVNVEGHPLYIGMLDDPDILSVYEGKIDDIRIYDRCINADEVTALYNPTEHIDSSLVAFYPFCGNADDLSGNGHHGTLNGDNITLTEDRFGNPNSAYLFDGNSDFIFVENSPILDNLTDSFTISVLYKPLDYDSINDRWVVLISKSTPIQSEIERQLTLYYNNTNDIHFNYDVLDYQSPTLNEWHSLTVTYATPTINFYLDGMNVGSVPATPITPRNFFMDIGRDLPAQNEFFNGVMDEVRIYDRVLAEEEIFALADTNFNCAEILANNTSLHFDDASGNGDDWISIPNLADEFENGDDFAFETWFNTTAAPDAAKENIIFAIQKDLSSADSHHKIRIGTGSVGGIFTKVGWFDGEEYGQGYNDGLWHHLAVSIPNGGAVSIYVDGALIASPNLGTVNWTSANTAHFGQEFDSSGTTDFYEGALSGAKIWKRDLPSIEIYNSYCNGYQCEQNDSTLVACYSFDQGLPNQPNPTENILIDESPNGFNGNLNNFELNGDVSNWIDGVPVPTCENCPTGNITFTSQAQIDTYPFECPFTGNVTISGDDISNLDDFSVVTSIPGDLTLDDNDILNNTFGLMNIDTVDGHIYIRDNDAMTDVPAFDSLNYVGGCIEITGNGAMTDISGFGSLNYVVKYITISNNDTLSSLTGFMSLDSLGGDIRIDSNVNIINVSGFGGVIFIGGHFYVNNNTNLNDLSGFSNLTTINNCMEIINNAALMTLQWFGNLTSIGNENDNDPLNNYLNISWNGSLTDLEGFGGITFIFGSLIIENNPVLMTLGGLDNTFLGSGSITNVTIQNCPELIICQVPCICDIIMNGGEAIIINNAEGCNSTEEILALCTVSTTTLEDLPNITISPNPTNGIFTLQGITNGIYQIHNTSGQIIRQGDMQNDMLIDMSREAQGIYFISVTVDDATSVRRMVKM